MGLNIVQYSNLILASNDVKKMWKDVNKIKIRIGKIDTYLLKMSVP